METIQIVQQAIDNIQDKLKKHAYYKYTHNVPYRVLCSILFLPYLYYEYTVLPQYLRLISEEIDLDAIYLAEIQKTMPRAIGFKIDKTDSYFSRTELNSYSRSFHGGYRLHPVVSATIELTDNEKLFVTQVRYQIDSVSRDLPPTVVDLLLMKHDHSEKLMDFNFRIEEESIGLSGKHKASKNTDLTGADLENRELEKYIKFVHNKPVKIRNLFTVSRQEKWLENQPLIISPNISSWSVINTVSKSGNSQTYYTKRISGHIFNIDVYQDSLKKMVLDISNEIRWDMKSLLPLFVMFRLLTEKH